MDYQAQAELEIEFNSRFDYMSEAYGQTARDCNAMAAEDEYWERVAELEAIQAEGFSEAEAVVEMACRVMAVEAEYNAKRDANPALDFPF